MSKYSVGTYDLRVKRGTSGRGLFAYSPIKKGSCVVEYFGRTLTPAEEYTCRMGRNKFILHLAYQIIKDILLSKKPSTVASR